MACDFQQCGILKSVDTDEPVQPPFKLRNSKYCSVSSLTLIKYSSDRQRLWSDCAYAQADLRLYWSHTPHCWKSHVAAKIYRLYKEMSVKVLVYLLFEDMTALSYLLYEVITIKVRYYLLHYDKEMAFYYVSTLGRHATIHALCNRMAAKVYTL